MSHVLILIFDIHGAADGADSTMTKYHRTMLIEKAIDHWNHEKYREQGDVEHFTLAMTTNCPPGRLILTNVKHAISIRDESQAALAGLLRRLRMTEGDVKEAHDAHCRFIRSGVSEHADNMMRERQIDIDYLQHLEGFQSSASVLIDGRSDTN